MPTVLITGASRGMGAVTARRLASSGFTVFAGARRPERVVEELREMPGSSTVDIRPVALDVTDDSSVRAAVREVSRAAEALDVLINNAGLPGTWAAAEDVRAHDFDDVIATNLLGPVRVTQAFLPLLRRSEKPRLVMVSSGMGSFDRQTADPVYRDIAHVPYPASKAALNMVAVQYAKALPDVLVTSVDPGLTATEFTNGMGHSVEEGSDVIVKAALDTTGPSGRFLDTNGSTAW